MCARGRVCVHAHACVCTRVCVCARMHACVPSFWVGEGSSFSWMWGDAALIQGQGLPSQQALGAPTPLPHLAAPFHSGPVFREANPNIFCVRGEGWRVLASPCPSGRLGVQHATWGMVQGPAPRFQVLKGNRMWVPCCGVSAEIFRCPCHGGRVHLYPWCPGPRGRPTQSPLRIDSSGLPVKRRPRDPLLVRPGSRTQRGLGALGTRPLSSLRGSQPQQRNRQGKDARVCREQTHSPRFPDHT